MPDDRDAADLLPGDEAALNSLHPAHLKVMRVQASLAALPFVVAALVLERLDLLPSGAWTIPVVLLAAVAIARIPLRRYRATGYSVGNGRLRIVRGLLYRADTTVPFGRVQHIDLRQGPLERLYGLATLTVHTAGTHNASVHLPGLGHDEAASVRDAIRAYIGRETL